MAKVKAKKKNRHIAARIAALVILAIILAVSLIWQDNINRALGLKKQTVNDYDGMSADEVISTTIGGDLNLHFVDVGQGDATIIELPDSKKMIIDGGKDKEKQKLLEYIPKNIQNGGKPITEFDFAILTHADEDHCGGMDDVMEKYPAKVFYRPNELASKSGFVDPGKKDLLTGFGAQSTTAYMRAISAAYENQTKVVVTDALNDEQNIITPDGLNEGDEGYYSINFYSPIKPFYNDRNDYSPIIILEYKNQRVALSGDAEKQAEADFVNNIENKAPRFEIFTEIFTVNVIKLGHHGSKTSSSEAYLKALTTPDSRAGVIIIISCGVGNSYKHPHTEVLDRLKKLGFSDGNILRTDVNSHLALSVHKDTDNSYKLFYGATAVINEGAALSLGNNVDIMWKEIAVSLWLIVAVILIVQPICAEANSRFRKTAKQAEKSTNYKSANSNYSIKGSSSSGKSKKPYGKNKSSDKKGKK